MLEDGGFDTEAVANLEAFDKALAWWHPQAVVVDVNMPGKSGLEIVAELGAHESGPPVVLMSAMADSSLAQLAQLGFELVALGLRLLARADLPHDGQSPEDLSGIAA